MGSPFDRLPDDLLLEIVRRVPARAITPLREGNRHGGIVLWTRCAGLAMRFSVHGEMMQGLTMPSRHQR